MIIGGETFRVEVEGDPTRPVLLLANSLGTDLTLWDAQMPRFLERFRVVRYDSRGHGGSVVSAGPYSIGMLGRDVLRILDALEIDKAHFAGISMGGAVGQWLLAHAPARIERAVLVCTAARFGSPETWNARILAVLGDGMSAIVDGTMERWFSPTFSAREPAQVARVQEIFLASPAAGYVACCAALRDMDLRQALHGVETPVLVITGAEDPVVSAADAAFLLSALASAQHVALDTRHIANIEAGPRFADAVVTFLTSKIALRRKPAAAAPRGKTARRATAARQPLARAATKAVSTRKKAAAAKSRKPTTARRKTRAIAPAGTARTKAAARAPTKATSAKKSPVKKALAKRKTTRRPTTTAAARSAVKKPTAKAKPTKAIAKKAVAKKTLAKPTKRPPAPRRKPAKTPRRPTGRRKT